VLRQEQLGWRLGITAYTFHKYTMFETIDKTAALGISYLGGLNFQMVSAQIPKPFNCELTNDELQQIRTRLDSAGIRLVTCFYDHIPGDSEGCRRVFEFARKMGIETLISEPDRAALDTIERFCDEYDVRLAIHNHDRQASPDYWSPEAILQVCQGRSPRVGACPDLGYWLRSGIDPVQGIRLLGPRLITLQLHDLHALHADGHDVPWGTGVGSTEQVLREIHRQGLQPTLFGLEYSYDWLDSLPEIAASREFFDEVSLRLPDSSTPHAPP
jgi:sugar phosphate isomerase/epimerase